MAAWKLSWTATRHRGAGRADSRQDTASGESTVDNQYAARDVPSLVRAQVASRVNSANLKRHSQRTALTAHLGKQVRLASSRVPARHPRQEEAAALTLPSDAAVLVREDIHENQAGTRPATPVRYGPETAPG